MYKRQGKGGVAGATPSRLGGRSTGGATRTRDDTGKSKELAKLQDKLKRELLQLLSIFCYSISGTPGTHTWYERTSTAVAVVVVC